jgi:hypothetical protein
MYIYGDPRGNRNVEFLSATTDLRYEKLFFILFPITQMQTSFR